jgi:hypothetical protein
MMKKGERNFLAIPKDIVLGQKEENLTQTLTNTAQFKESVESGVG